jgi:hypothetical protein
LISFSVLVLINSVVRDYSKRLRRRRDSTTVKERKAFFHGLLTGYAVALKLW